MSEMSGVTGYDFASAPASSTSEISIINLALRQLGVEGIGSLSAEESSAATAARDAFPLVRDALLREHSWPFSLETIQLALDVIPCSNPDFEGAYPLPADCLQVVHVDDGGGSTLVGGYGRHGQPWRVEGRRLLANASSSVRLTYVKRVTDPAMFDPMFTRALVFALAVDLAHPLTGSDKVAARMQALYADALRRAHLAAAIEQGPVHVVDSDQLTFSFTSAGFWS